MQMENKNFLAAKFGIEVEFTGITRRQAYIMTDEVMERIHHSPSLAKNPLFILTKALHNILANTRDIFSKWMAEQNLTPALTYLISVCCLSSSPLQAPAKRNRG
jgi:hypothetical protein